MDKLAMLRKNGPSVNVCNINRSNEKRTDHAPSISVPGSCLKKPKNPPQTGEVANKGLRRSTVEANRPPVGGMVFNWIAKAGSMPRKMPGTKYCVDEPDTGMRERKGAYTTNKLTDDMQMSSYACE